MAAKMATKIVPYAKYISPSETHILDFIMSFPMLLGLQNQNLPKLDTSEPIFIHFEEVPIHHFPS